MKHTYKFICLSFLLSLAAFTAQAQVEDCFNGIDDDGDGYIDCADPDAYCYLQRDCSIETDCGNGVDDDGDGFFDYYDGDCLNDPNNPNDYITIKPDCEAQPVGNVFEIEPAWDSDIKTSAALGMPSVADLDQDGFPEVITMNSETGTMYILDGRTGNTLRSVSVKSGQVYAYPAVGDVDGDGFGEIFTIDLNGVIRVYEHDLTLKWTQTSSFTGFGRALGLADFNNDGKAELYSVNEIWDAETGTLLIKGSHGSSMYPSGNSWQDDLNAVPVAVEIISASPGLELVLGHIIYTVKITNTTGTAGNSLTEAKNMDDAKTKPLGYNGYHPADADYGNQTYSQTAVVDYNLDGNLDVIMGGANGGINGPTTAFFWDLAADEVKMFTVLRPGNTIPDKIKGTFADSGGGGCDNSSGSSEKCYWKRGLGNINIADIDKDGQLEATFMSGSSLYALETDFTEKWANHTDFWESSSGFTGTTIFDFDGDGSSEVVYRDEINLYIIDGTTGNPLNFLTGTLCSSQTQGDYPIVADVDGDGETEIIVSCGQEINIFGEDPATSSTRTNGFIRAYKAAGGNYWVPSRSLWNQTNYFNVNINDNLTIPRYQQAHHLNFAQICNDPSAPASFSLNKFLNQSPKISYCGQLTFPSPKLDFDSAGGVYITPPVCPDNQFEVRLVFQNNGDQDITKPIPVSFYAANPTNSYGNADQSPYLETIDINITGGVKIDQKVDTTIMVNGLRGAFTLFVSLNDIGQNDSIGNPMTNEDFYPLTKLNGTIRECDDTPTIVSKAIDPLPFEVKAVKIRDNRNCPGEVAYNNGEIQVLAPDDTPFPASSYAFTWTNISTGDVISSDALVTGLDAGTYQVIVENTDYGCFGSADTVTVLRFEEWPDTQVITLEKLQAVSSCTPGTADGIARILINGAAIDETEYDIEWADEQQGGSVIIGDTATNLKPILYKVTVTNKLTGCSESETIDMSLDLPQLDPNPTVTDNTNCKNPNGKITAQLLSGNIADYDFMLIQLSPSQDTVFSTNPSFNSLAAGFYELRAYNPTTECGRYSTGVEVEIEDKKTIDDLTVEVENPQTSCEGPYTGQLRANIASASNYTFVWYRGTVTTGPGVKVVGNTAITEDTLSTNLTDIYTVVVTHKTTGCSTSEQVQLNEAIVYPNPDISNFTINHQTKCNPDGSIQAVVANPQAGATYVYRLLQGSTELDSNNTGLFEKLEAGPYVVTIENTVTSCVSNPSSIVQVEDRIDPFGAITITETPVTNCNSSAPNGTLSLSLADGNANYAFKWFVGVDTSTAVSPQPPTATAYALTNIEAGDYIVKITNKNSGCITTDTLVLEDKSADYQDKITASVTRDQEFCFPSTFSGVIQASLLQSTSGSMPDVNDYTFYWYKGKKNDVRIGTATLIPGENSDKISGQNVGWYSVRAVKNDGSGCHAIDTAEVKIDDMRDFPITNIDVTVVNQSSCNSSDPNGSLTGDVGGTTTGYTFTWYQLIGGVKTDVDVNNPTANISGNSVTNIGVGTYLLEVKNSATGCTGETQVYLKDNIIKGSEIRLNLSSNDATLCSPPNGEAYVSSIDLSEDDGATFTMTDDPNNYNYQWYYGEDITTPVDPLTNPTAATAHLENIEPGMYTVVANNKTSECASVSYSVEVGSEIQNQLKFKFAVDSQSDCLNPNGGLEVYDISGGTGPFDYQWYKGGDDTYPLIGEINPRLDQIRADKYMVRITDQTTGCYKDSVYVLPPDQGITPVPPATLSTVDHVDTCVPGDNGRLVGEVDPTLLTDPLSLFFGYNPDDFFYYWFKGENPKYKNASFSPIDDISNFDVLNNDPPVIGDNKAEITDLEPGFYTVIVVDAKDYVASGGVQPLGCRSDPRTFEVKAIAKSPEVVFTTQNDSYCVGDNGEANITIGKRSGDTSGFTGFVINAATQNGNNFFPIPGTVTATSNDDGVAKQTTILLENLNAASYTFTLFDNTTQCDTTINLDISDISVAPILYYDNVKVNSHKTSCNPENGEVEVVASVSTNGITNLADYDFYWHDAIQSVSTDVIANAIQTGTVASGLDVGIYYVYAVDKVTGCVSSNQSIEIKDEVPSTIIEIASDSPDRNCDPTKGTGTINIRIHDEDIDGNVVYPIAGYTITWKDENGVDISAQATTNGGTQPATSILPDLLAGVYIISVENNDTQCGFTIARDTIRNEPYFPKFTAASAQITHSTTCDGNGEITIGQVKENITVILSSDPAFADYSFEWRYSDDVTVIKDASNTPITGNVLTDLLPGTYYVYVTNTNTGGCTSPANRLQIVIGDDSHLPLIYEQERIHFISCTGINEGAIEVFGGEFISTDVPALGYQYDWTMADGSPMPLDAVYNADRSRVSNLMAGTYEVSMTNLSTGCSQTAEYTIKESVILPILTVTKIADQTYCYGNGEAEVSSITDRSGNALDPNNFTFYWYESDQTTGIASPQYGLSADLVSADSLVAGTYFVIAEDNVNGCQTFPVQVTVMDESVNLIVLLDDISDPIIGCDPSNIAEGEIEIEVRNSTTTITSWYSGSTITDPADSIPGFNNSFEIEDLTPGTYSVWVQDTLTGCSTTRSYTIEGIEVSVVLSTSSVDLRSCIQPDGKIAANINGGSGDYTINWYKGSGTDLQAIASAANNTFVEGLADGTYTIIVQDKVDPYCDEVRSEVIVEDNRGEETILTVNNNFQMTNCDENSPNGQLSVEVSSGELSRYNFFWYSGTNTSNKPIASGPVIAKLVPGKYTVLARDKVTGCVSQPFSGEVIAVPDTTIIPAPVVSTTPVTRCDAPNGTATAVLDSAFINLNVDYEYTWFNNKGEVVFSSSRDNTANFLTEGDYTVVATNVLSGCSSESATFSIGENIYVPEFEIITTPSTCLEANGSIRLEFMEPIKIVDIEWITPEGFATGFYLVNQPTGVYEVTITDDKGCKHTKTAEIKSNIHVYNGVSPNGDGKNDRFIISCIEQYNENVVRIYNRTGAIVFEDFNYDNDRVYFEGYGNKGLYIGGDKLPEGTYYYIVDKRNGEEPVSGYLELLR